MPNPAYDPKSPAGGKGSSLDTQGNEPNVGGATKPDTRLTPLADASALAIVDTNRLDVSAQPLDTNPPARETADAFVSTPLPLASTLRDDFADGVPIPTWTAELNGPCTIVEQNSQVRFNNAGSAASHCAYRSKGFYDLRGSFVQQRVPNITNYYPAVRAFLRVENKLGQSAQIGFVGTDNMFFEATGLASLLIPYGHQQELWWRIGESNGNLFWETSPDAATWMRKRLAVSTLDVSEVQIVTGEETSGPMPASVTIGYDTLGSP